MRRGALAEHHVLGDLLAHRAHRFHASGGSLTAELSGRFARRGRRRRRNIHRLPDRRNLLCGRGNWWRRRRSGVSLRSGWLRCGRCVSRSRRRIRRSGRLPGSSAACGEKCIHVLFRDAATRAGAAHLIQIDIILARHLANEGESGPPCALRSRREQVPNSLAGREPHSPAPRLAAAAGGGVGRDGRCISRGPVRSRASAMRPTTVLIPTVVPSCTRISPSVPADGDGISVSTLSVEISNSGSSRSTCSPAFFSQRVNVPSTMLSPIWGMTTSIINSPVNHKISISRSNTRPKFRVKAAITSARSASQPSTRMDVTGFVKPQGTM